jgi:hypothetical protein
MTLVLDRSIIRVANISYESAFQHPRALEDVTPPALAEGFTFNPKPLSAQLSRES